MLAVRLRPVCFPDLAEENQGLGRLGDLWEELQGPPAPCLPSTVPSLCRREAIRVKDSVASSY